MSGITVVVPVGPSEANRRWLKECLDSVAAQTLKPAEVLLIDDTSQRTERSFTSDIASLVQARITWRVWKSPWNLGVAHAFNCGIGLASNALVFMLGSDDTLEPGCLQACLDAYYANNQDPLGYYFVGVRYMDTGEEQNLACHAAMVTKALWQHTGGFPLQSASGAPDSAFLSILIGNSPNAGRLRDVAGSAPLYNYRRHDETDTASKGPWQGVILQTRDLVTRLWTPRNQPSEALPA